MNNLMSVLLVKFNCIGNECPPNECDLVCVNGFKTDDNGCEICDCIPCPSIICAAPCENGFKVGNNGCPSCECNDGKII